MQKSKSQWTHQAVAKMVPLPFGGHNRRTNVPLLLVVKSTLSATAPPGYLLKPLGRM